MANQLVLAISHSAIYFPLCTVPISFYAPTIADSLFWYHMDFAVRLASSGWDRVALLLDIAFELDTRRECSLSRVLQDIPRTCPDVVRVDSFKRLKKFRDGAFADIEGPASLGSRHEITHIMSPSIRLFCEFLETWTGQAGKVLPAERAEERLKLVIRHHGLLLEGIGAAIELVSWKWPTKQ